MRKSQCFEGLRICNGLVSLVSLRYSIKRGVIQHVLPKLGNTLQKAIIQHFTPNNTILSQVYIRLSDYHLQLLTIHWHLMQDLSR